MDDTYRTIETSAEGGFRDRGSKFLGYAFPARTEDDVKNRLQELKKAHPSARHYCYAYRLGPSGDTWRVNDDGEPSGSAGHPILNLLHSAGLTYITLIVVRYFGGKLLGVPGLINAYKQAAARAIERAVVVEKTVDKVYTVVFGYEHMDTVMRFLKQAGLKVLDQQYENTRCLITFEIRKSAAGSMLDFFQARHISPVEGKPYDAAAE